MALIKKTCELIGEINKLIKGSVILAYFRWVKKRPNPTESTLNVMKALRICLLAISLICIYTPDNKIFFSAN